MRNKTVKIFAYFYNPKTQEYEAGEELAAIRVTSDPFVYTKQLKYFQYDSYLVDFLGTGNIKIDYLLTAYDSADSNTVIAQKEMPLSINLQNRGRGYEQTATDRAHEQRGGWSAQTGNHKFEPMMQDQAIKPSSNKFFTFSYSLNVYPKHHRNVYSIWYKKDGEHILATDDQSRVYLYHINTKRKVWETVIHPNTRFESYIFGVREDDREFLTSEMSYRQGSHKSLNVHSMDDGRIIHKINEQSKFYYKVGAGGAVLDYRDKKMIPVAGQYSEDGKYIISLWRNENMRYGLNDIRLICYNAYTYQKVWEWQVNDPKGRDFAGVGRHHVLAILPVAHNRFILFSETGDVRLLTENFIKKTEREQNFYTQSEPRLLYRMELVRGSVMPQIYPLGFVKTDKKNEYIIGAANDDRVGKMARINVMTGKVLWMDSWDLKFTTMAGCPIKRYIITRANFYWNIWDTKTKHIVASGAYFLFSNFKAMAIHPKKKEIAISYANKIWFLTEKTKKTVRLTNNWRKTGIFINDETELTGFSAGDIHIVVAMNKKDSDGELSYKTNFDRSMHAGGPYNWDGLYLQRYREREVYAKSEANATWEIWGGWNRNEINYSLKQIRDNLPAWAD